MFQCEFDHPCCETVRGDQSDWLPQSRLDIPTGRALRISGAIDIVALLEASEREMERAA